MKIQSSTTLNNGVEMPWLGLGVFKLEEGGEVEQAVEAAVAFGYRHIDTAASYGNEAGVGRAIRSSSVPREEIFVTTKVWNGDQRAGTVRQAFETSLGKLDIGYIDLYLVHWPVEGKFVDTWKVLEELYSDGKIRAIGVSNHHQHHLEEVLAVAEIVPAVNQIELHPELTQVELRNFCREHDIQVEAWSPLAKAKLLNHETLTPIASAHNVTTAQVILRWHLQNSIVAIPKSSKIHRIHENGSLFHFELTQDQMAAIDGLNQNRRVGPDPDNFGF